MTLSLIITLILIGLLLLILEILVIPGSGVVGVIGFAMIAAGIFYTYKDHDSLTGHLVLASSFILSAAGVYLSIRSKTWKYAMLNTKIDGKSPGLPENLLKKGDKGIAISRLAPAGTAIFGETKCEVHTLGEFVDAGSELEIIKTEQQKIIVKSI